MGAVEYDDSIATDYYIEYGIKNKAIESYGIFTELLGKYFAAPNFDVESGSVRITFDEGVIVYSKPEDENEPASHAQVESKEDTSASEQASEEADQGRFQSEKYDTTWITEFLEFAEGELKLSHHVENPLNENQFSDLGKALKKVFYNTQQSCYYVDYTLEQGMFFFEKIGETDKAEDVEAKRKIQEKRCRYMLLELIRPLRFSMRMWTRYNVDQMFILDVRDRFLTHFEDIKAGLEKLNPSSFYNPDELKEHNDEMANC